MCSENKGIIRPLFHKPAPRPTIAEVKAITGFENITDQEAEQYLDDLEQLCRIMCLVRNNKGSNDNEYQQAA